MSTDETSAYLQAKLQQAQGQTQQASRSRANLQRRRETRRRTQLEEQPQALVDMQSDPAGD